MEWQGSVFLRETEGSDSVEGFALVTAMDGRRADWSAVVQVQAPPTWLLNAQALAITLQREPPIRASALVTKVSFSSPATRTFLFELRGHDGTVLPL